MKVERDPKGKIKKLTLDFTEADPDWLHKESKRKNGKKGKK